MSLAGSSKLRPATTTQWNILNGLELDALKLILVARGEEFTERDKSLMEILYSDIELQSNIASLGEVADWLLEKKEWTDTETVTFILEYGGQL